MSNLWDEYRFWLTLNSSVVRPVLALVADVHTQNVFFVVKEDNDEEESNNTDDGGVVGEEEEDTKKREKVRGCQIVAILA